MATLTPEGIVPRTLSEYIALLEGIFRQALGEDMATDPETPQGQLIRGIAPLFVQMEDALQYIAGALNLNRMIGQQIDDIADLFGVVRKAAAKSTATVTFSGVAATVIREGFRVRSVAGDIFATDSEVTIGSGGTVDADVTAVEAGPRSAEADTITVRVDSVVGVTSVTNAAAATIGRDVESDTAFRARMRESLARNAVGTAEALRARVLAVEGVNAALVVENRTAAAATVSGLSLAAHATAVIVDGGSDANVAEAIYLGTFPGQVLHGSTSVTHTPASAPSGDVTIKFTRVTKIPVIVRIDATGNSAFPRTGHSDIEANVFDWWNGDWDPLNGAFFTGGVGIGVLPSIAQLYVPVLQVSGTGVTSLTMEKASDNSAISSVNADEQLTLIETDIILTVTLS